MNYLIAKLKQHQSLLNFTFLNYIDKFIAFSLPLGVLYFYKDQNIYNDIEYVFSVASIFVIFLDFGINTYYFYGFKESKDRSSFIEKVRHYFGISIVMYMIIGLLLFPISFFFKQVNFLIFFVCIRILYLLFLNFHASYFRLKDSPSKIYWYSIPINLLTIALVVVLKNTSNSILFWFFIPQLLLLCISSYYFIRFIKFIDVKEFKLFMKEAILFSWPIILNVSLIAYVGNFGKIYAYNYLSSDEMYQISYTLRISLIIQMAHTSIISFYSKAIYEDDSSSFNFNILKKYIIFLSVALFLFFGFILIMNQLKIVTPINLDVANLLIVIYTLLWCFRSYIELYFGKHNKNKVILIISVVSTSLFTGYILIFGVKDIMQITLLMATTATFSFLITMYNLKQIITMNK